MVAIEEEHKRIAMQQQNQMILVKPELMSILDSFGESFVRGRSSSKSARALSALKVNAKASKKRSYEDFMKGAGETSSGLGQAATGFESNGKRMKMS